jgi:hypothetical protein
MKDQEFIVQKIRTQYTEKQHTELEALKPVMGSGPKSVTSRKGAPRSLQVAFPEVL